MPKDVAIPVVKGVSCPYLIHLFPGPEKACNFGEIGGKFKASPSPTKLLPRYNENLMRWELSVILYADEGFPPWDAGKELYKKGSGQAYGGVEMDVWKVDDAGLGVESRPGHVSEYHGNVIGWPDDEDDHQAYAIALARAGTVLINPDCRTRYEAFFKQKQIEYKKLAMLRISVSPLLTK